MSHLKQLPPTDNTLLATNSPIPRVASTKFLHFHTWKDHRSIVNIAYRQKSPKT